MKNIARTWSVKPTTLIVSALMLVLITSVSVAMSPGGSMRSVEFGLAELSPRGLEGGYAVPASGESTSPLTASYVCNAGGSTITLTVAFTYSSSRQPPSAPIMINGKNYGAITYGTYTTVNNGSTKTTSRTFQFPASGTYTVQMSGYLVGGTKDDPVQSFSYTAVAGPVNCSSTSGPSVDLEVRNNTAGTSWVDGPININPTDDLDLRWESSNVTSCSGSNFTVPNSAVSGTQTSVTNPTTGTSRTYTILCTGRDGSANDSVVVNATGSGVGGPPTLDSNPVYVIRGDDADLEWNTNGNNPASCTLTGPGVSISPLSAVTGTYTVTVYGESMYTLTCPGGIDTATVRVLPVLQET